MTLNLGISGYLYRNAVLYYDKETNTFWSQMTGEAVVGPNTGKRLKWIPTTVTTWSEWKKKHPETTVLKPVLPSGRYRQTNQHYKTRYRATDRLMFPMKPGLVDNTQYKNKDACTIVLTGNGPRCYPHKAFSGTIEDGDLTITKKDGEVTVTDKKGEKVPSLHAYWFAWCAFYPKGTVWQPAK